MVGPFRAAQRHQPAATGKTPLAKQVVALGGKAGSAPGRFIGGLGHNQGRRNHIQLFRELLKLFGAAVLPLNSQPVRLPFQPLQLIVSQLVFAREGLQVFPLQQNAVVDQFNARVKKREKGSLLFGGVLVPGKIRQAVGGPVRQFRQRAQGDVGAATIVSDRGRWHIQSTGNGEQYQGNTQQKCPGNQPHKTSRQNRYGRNYNRLYGLRLYPEPLRTFRNAGGNQQAGAQFRAGVVLYYQEDLVT